MVDVSAGALVRAGSGILLVLLGLAVVALGRRDRANVAFGVFAAALGATFPITNILMRGPGSEEAVAATWVAFGLWHLAGAALAVAALTGFPTGARPALPALAAGGIFLLLSAWSVLDGPTPGYDDPRIPPWYALTSSLAGDVASSAALVLVLATAGRARTAEARDRPRLALAAIGVGIYFAFTLAVGAISGVPSPAEAPVFLLLAAAAWLHASVRCGASGVAVAWALLAAGLVGTVDAAVLGTNYGGQSSVVVGLVRILAVAVLAYALLRHRLLGHDLPLPTVRRGGLATVGLVSFFAVAQIAQEFLSDTMGVVLGGAAAGALLFAAAPLQRAAERLVAAPRSRPTPASSVAAYRAAVRAALQDGPLTPEKEAHLAEVADALGISYAEALAIRREVETTARPAKP